MGKNKHSKLSEFNVILWVSGLIVIAMTPWVNLDSLIIPKLILLFSLAMFFLPNLILRLKVTKKGFALKILLILSSLFLVQVLFSILASSAPLEQQVFGRTGRGLGAITYFSVIVLMILTATISKVSSVNLIQRVLLYSGSVTSVYSILQYFGIDLFQWNTKTNGIIGTLGNPNFQSSFAAATLLPSIFYIYQNGKRFLSIPVLMLFIVVIFIANSTQGYIILVTSFLIYSLNYFWFRNKIFFMGIFVSALALISFAVLGMLNKGPLSYYLYKVSVTSRGEFWRTAISMIRDNLAFGVGIDSFGDWSQFYKDSKTLNGINEFTDNSHNYFLEFAATGGIFLAFLYFAIVCLVFIVYIKFQKRLGKFDSGLTTLFIFWIGLQLQSLISPGSISLFTWNFIMSGFIIGLYNNNETENFQYEINKQFIRPFSYFLLGISIIFTYPFFNADKLTLKAFRTADGSLAVKAAQSFPESTVRYSRIGQELVQSQLWPQALEVGRAASEFNPNSISAWLIILANPTAPIDERINAQKMVLKLDPFNEDIRNIQLK